MIALTLRHYLSRFGWKIAAFWAISICNTVLLARGGPPGALRAMAVLEIVALAWITVRLVLAEDGFKTSGGWQTRPFSHKIRLGLPLALAVVVVIFAAILRALAFQRMFDGAALWSDFGPGSWWRQVGAWFLFFALPLKLFGVLILQRIEGRARTAAWATLALILLPLVAAMGENFGNRKNTSSSGSNDPKDLAQGIQQELPDATDFIGAWSDPIPEYLTEIPAAKMVAKFFIDLDASPPGASVSFVVVSQRGSRVNVRIRALLEDKGLAGRLENAVAILRYEDGTCATCVSRGIARPGVPLPFFPATEWEFSGDFVSPLSLPEFEGDPKQLTRGLELMFFEQDWNRPRLPVDPSRKKTLDLGGGFHFSSSMTVPELFNQLPSSDPMWEKHVLPFLVEHATRDDIPFLLDRLPLDPRLASVFIRKGWTAEAMPALRQLTKECIPMAPDAIVAVATEKDPALAGDLAAIALQLRFGLDQVEPALRAQPGFDWPAFASELWRRKKYTTNWLQPYGEFWQPAFWAAQEGDFTALRETAEQAAAGKKWESEHLRKLVPDAPEDIVAYLRENLDQLKYHPPTRTWRK
jgi:uncharacterized membrane protein